jgi:uncharacterized protein
VTGRGGSALAPGQDVLPVTDDPDTSGFFAAAAAGQLALLQCSACGRWLHLPRAYCHYCASWAPEWTALSGEGRVVSWTVAEHQVHPAFPVPYTILLVELADGPGLRLVGCLDGRPAVTAGQSVRVRFEQRAEGIVLPQWDLVTGTPAPEGRPT